MLFEIEPYEFIFVRCLYDSFIKKHQVSEKVFVVIFGDCRLKIGGIDVVEEEYSRCLVDYYTYVKNNVESHTEPWKPELLPKAKKCRRLETILMKQFEKILDQMTDEDVAVYKLKHG